LVVPHFDDRVLAEKARRRARDAARARASGRRRNGRACYTIEATGPVLDMLVANNWITDAELSDTAAVASAVSRFLQAAAEKD
jgi:hypothetical protein